MSKRNNRNRNQKKGNTKHYSNNKSSSTYQNRKDFDKRKRKVNMNNNQQKNETKSATQVTNTSSNVNGSYPKKWTNHSYKLRKLAMIIIAIIMLASIVGVTAYCVAFPDVQATNTTTVTGYSNNTTITINKETMIPVESKVGKVAMIDKSGSYKDVQIATGNYETVVDFSSDLNVVGGNSYIATCVNKVLAMHKYQDFAVFSDLESYPTDEIDSILGNHYSDVSLVFYVPEDVKDYWVHKYTEVFSQVLENSNCTLAFEKANGEVIVAFDNYKPKYSDMLNTNSNVTTETKENPFEFSTTSTDDNSIPKSFVVMMMEMFFLIIMGLIEAILALVNIHEHQYEKRIVEVTGVPVDVNNALKDPLALDGSGSVANVFSKMLEYADKRETQTGTKLDIYMFTDGAVKRVSLAEAKKANASGGTPGWSCLKQMYENGCKRITIESDMCFNDSNNESEAVDKCHFEHIWFVLPKDSQIDEKILETVKAMADSFDIINI